MTLTEDEIYEMLFGKEYDKDVMLYWTQGLSKEDFISQAKFWTPINNITEIQQKANELEAGCTLTLTVNDIAVNITNFSDSF